MFKYLRSLKVIAGISLGDVADTMGVASFLREVLATSVIVTLAAVLILAASKYYSNKTDQTRASDKKGWAPLLLAGRGALFYG